MKSDAYLQHETIGANVCTLLLKTCLLHFQVCLILAKTNRLQNTP